MQAAPSLTADGSLIVGRRESRVFVLDRRTGQQLATLTADGGDQSGQLAFAGAPGTLLGHEASSLMSPGACPQAHAAASSSSMCMSANAVPWRRLHSLPGLSASEGLDRLLLVGRQDFTVRSLRVDTQAETWNATFARMRLLNPGGAGAAGVRGFLEGLSSGPAVGDGALPERPPGAAGAARRDAAACLAAAVGIGSSCVRYPWQQPV